jgi:hypothetical protein
MNIMIDPCQIIYILYNYIFKNSVSNKKSDDKIVYDNSNYNSNYNDDEDEYIII